MGRLEIVKQGQGVNTESQRGTTTNILEWLGLTEKQLRRQLHAERYIEQRLGLEIWDWKRDKLIALSVDLAYRINLHRILKLHLEQFCSYLEALADEYFASNTYHNFTHATDVLYVLCHLLLECNASSRMTEYEIMASFLAAHAHDVGHPGTNNHYQVAANTPLGVKYGESATLEAYSADLGQQLLEQYSILENIPATDLPGVISLFRSCILGTDMAQHNLTCLALRHLPDDFYIQNYPPKRPGRTNGESSTHALSLPALLLHAADLSGPCRDVQLWLTRSMAVTSEFVHQGDCERKHQIPVTPSFDRLILQAEGLDGFQRRENQFTRGLVLPYFRDVERVWNGIRPLRVNVEDNIRSWDSLDRQALTKVWTSIFV